MGSWLDTWRIRYQSQVDPTFFRNLQELPGGESIARCIQCGTCAGTCPVSHFMDYTPRRIIAMARAGLAQDVLSCFTIWLCASCYACTAACPQKIPITDVMYALKRLAIQRRTYPRRFPVPILAREFFRVVGKRGRNSEGEVTLRMYLKAGPWRHVSKAGLGLRMYLKGRLGVVPDKIRDRAQLSRLLGNLEQRLAGVSQQRQEPPLAASGERAAACCGGQAGGVS
jgi:heterodisulfide reductase subunit C